MPKHPNELGKMKLNKQVKYLGIILQDDLPWNSHLSNLKKN